MRSHARSSAPLLAAICFFLVSASFSYAQILDTGNATSTPIPGAGHDYLKMVNETVNPANGSVSIRIEAPVPPGRGITLPFTFAYDSNGALHPAAGANGTVAWLSNTAYLSQGGWSYSVPMLSMTQKYVVYPSPPYQYTCYYFTDYVFQGATGGRDSLGLSTWEHNYVAQCQNIPNAPQIFTNGADALYGAYTPNPVNCNNCNPYPPVTVADTHGTAYYFSGQKFRVGSGYLNSLPDYVEDRNGNYAAINDQGSGVFTITDSAGRAAISSSGFGATGNTVTVSGLSSPYTVGWSTTGSLNYSVNPVQVDQDSNCAFNNASGNLPVIVSIKLPNNQSYTFTYDPTYGLLKQITYPTGGWVKYTWGLNSKSEFGAFVDSKGTAEACQYEYDSPVVLTRAVSFDGTTTALQQSFTYSTAHNANGTWSSKKTTVTTTDNVTGASFRTVYAYTPYGLPLPPNELSYFSAEVPLESEVDAYNAATGGTLLRTVIKGWWSQYELGCQQTTLGPSGPSSMQLFYYSTPAAEVTGKYEYDFGTTCPASLPQTPPTASLLRQTAITLASFSNTPLFPAAAWPHGAPIYDRPLSVITYDGSGDKKAETDYVYDGGSLGSSGVGTGHDSNYSTSMDVRGNPTTKTQKCLYNCSSDAVTTYAYDDTGQVISMHDPNGNPTSYSYADDYSSGSPPGQTNAYLTKITDALNFTQTFSYSYAAGEVTSSTDRNQKTTNYAYNDPLARLTEIDYPDSGKMTHAYTDGSPTSTVVTSQNVASGTTYVATQVTDGVGHVIQTQLNSDPDCSGGSDNADTTYAGTGWVYKVSNPHCSSTGHPSDGTTVYTYDALGRVTSVNAPDNSPTSTSYAGNTTTVTDPQSHVRESWSDALGRMYQVTEDPSGLNYSTSYTYDPLNNLATVTQGSQTRSFVYDSLSRVYSATTPESDTTQYSYDANGNLMSRTDNRNITTNYCAYDGLNRVTCKTYSDGTPAAHLYYDESSVTVGAWTSPTLAYPTGRLTHTTTLSSSGTILTATVQDYDPMGRTQNYWQCAPSSCGASSIPHSYYHYNLSGDVDWWTHPAGYNITNTITTARRVQQIQSSWTDSEHPQYLAQNITYTPWGAPNQFVNGYAGSSGVEAEETYQYNNRLQPALVELGTTSNSTADYCLVYNYYSGVSNPSSCAVPTQGTTNNGSTMGYWYSDSVNSSFDHAATYTYDHVNRLTSASATGNSNYNLTFSYTQDGSNGQYGNMTCVTNGQTNGLCTNLAFSASTNHITSSGYAYDSAGNLTTDSSNLSAHTYQWDAEERVSSVDNGATWTFTYNALGHRVQWGSQQYLFDPAGGWLGVAGSYSVLRWSDKALVVYTATETYFNHVNNLGSTSMFTSHTGGSAEDMLFYPWGNVWQTWGGGGYNFAKLPYRDVTTNTDITPARFSSPNFGRWFSPDPIGKAAVQLGDPQTWNMYAYVRNNPTTLTDPNGTCAMTCNNILAGMTNVINNVPQEPDAADWTAVEESMGHDAANPTIAKQEQQGATSSGQNQNASKPAPTNPDGTPKPPPVPPPPGADGKPNEWVPVPGTDGRSVKWKPRDPVPSPEGGQPSASWDEKKGHWDIDDGNRNRTRYLPDGTKVDHHNNPIPMSTVGKIIGSGVALGVLQTIIETAPEWLPFALAPL
jgi:RHS repeat-associated protein